MELFEWRQDWLNNLFIWEKNLPSLIVLIIELTFLLLLFFARYNAQRLKIDRKLRILFTIVPLNLLVWFFYMGTKGFSLIERTLDPSQPSVVENIIRSYYTFIHGIFGAITMVLATFLIFFFVTYLLLNRKVDSSNPKFKPTKSILIALFIIWSIFVGFSIIILVPIGLIAGITMAIFMIVLVFVLNIYVVNEYQKVSLPTIRLMKPLMITTFICWTVTVSLGILIFIHFKIIEIFPSFV